MGKLWLFPSSVRENERWERAISDWNEIQYVYYRIEAGSASYHARHSLLLSSAVASCFMGFSKLRIVLASHSSVLHPQVPCQTTEEKCLNGYYPRAETFRFEKRVTYFHDMLPSLLPNAQRFLIACSQLNSLLIDCSLLCCCIFIHYDTKFPIESVTDSGDLHSQRISIPQLSSSHTSPDLRVADSYKWARLPPLFDGRKNGKFNDI